MIVVFVVKMLLLILKSHCWFLMISDWWFMNLLMLTVLVSSRYGHLTQMYEEIKLEGNDLLYIKNCVLFLTSFIFSLITSIVRNKGIRSWHARHAFWWWVFWCRCRERNHGNYSTCCGFVLPPDIEICICCINLSFHLLFVTWKDVLFVDGGDPWNPQPSTRAKVMAMMEGVHRVLKKDGIFVSITFGQVLEWNSWNSLSFLAFTLLVYNMICFLSSRISGVPYLMLQSLHGHLSAILLAMDFTTSSIPCARLAQMFFLQLRVLGLGGFRIGPRWPIWFVAQRQEEQWPLSCSRSLKLALLHSRPKYNKISGRKALWDHSNSLLLQSRPKCNSNGNRSLQEPINSLTLHSRPKYKTRNSI